MTGIESLLYPALTAGIALFLGAPVVLYYKRAAERASSRALLAAEDADRARALLAACPDASFVFEGARGAEFCSRRLARLLGLGSDGHALRFADVLAALAPADAETLARATERLRSDGTIFDTVVTRGGIPIAVAGTRARDAGGGTVADSLWFRPMPGPPAPEARPLPAEMRAAVANFNTATADVKAMTASLRTKTDAWFGRIDTITDKAQNTMGAVDVPKGLLASAGTIMGAYAGASVAATRGERIVKPLFLVEIGRAHV